jgi:hypothetical protein
LPLQTTDWKQKTIQGSRDNNMSSVLPCARVKGVPRMRPVLRAQNTRAATFLPYCHPYGWGVKNPTKKEKSFVPFLNLYRKNFCPTDNRLETKNFNKKGSTVICVEVKFCTIT